MHRAKRLRSHLPRRARKQARTLLPLAFALGEPASKCHSRKPCIVVDREGKSIYVIDKFGAISKYSRDEFLRQDHRMVSSSCYTEEFIRHLWQVIGSGSVWKGEPCNRPILPSRALAISIRGRVRWLTFVDGPAQSPSFTSKRAEKWKLALLQHPVRNAPNDLPNSAS
jgi:hypothetical protein